MLTRMSDSPNGDPPARASADGSGVLAGLPRTRPQRASARRAASRAAGPGGAPAPAATATATTTTAKTAARPASKRRNKPASARRRAAAEEPVPRQGYEAEPESLRGPVQPPGGGELIASAAELAGELAKSGVNTGARLVKDFLSRLPG